MLRRHGDVAALAFTHSFYAEVAAARGDIDEARRRRLDLLAFYGALPDDPFSGRGAVLLAGQARPCSTVISPRPSAATGPRPTGSRVSTAR